MRDHPVQRIVLLILMSSAAVSFSMQQAMGPDGINAYAVHAEGITGDGVNIALLSSGNVRQRHAAFDRSGKPAVSLYDFTGSAGLSWSNHDTQLAGILISGGSPSQPEAVGAAPGARIHSGRISARQLQARYLQDALDTLITQQHCRIIVTGIQLSNPSTKADGDSYWTRLYDYYAETYDVIFANAAGNLSSEITIFGDGFNGITTAALTNNGNGPYRQVGRASNSGPTQDGRKKPDIAAPSGFLLAPSSSGDDHWSVADPNGRGLTSFAIPLAAGTAALLLETAGRTAVADDDRSEVIKAVMVNSSVADLLDKQGNGALSNGVSVWNADYGYGRLDALRAYQTLMSGRILQNSTTQQRMGWAYDTMENGAEHVYRLTAQTGQRLVTTVTWHRKQIKLSSASYIDAPRFYLNLKIITPTGKLVVFEVPDTDNLIKAGYQLNEDGQYQIVLQNPTLTDNHDYGLAFELIDPESAEPADEN